MIVAYPKLHNLHQPMFEIFNGNKTNHQESSQRLVTILKALKPDHEIVDRLDAVPDSLLSRIHEQSYLDYLSSTQGLPQEELFYPSVFPLRSQTRNADNQIARRGWFCFDMYTPIHSQVYQVAKASAAASFTASNLVKSGAQRVAYALCRPPGHHAEPSQMGGYCYLNNAAVAAENLSDKGKVVVLDVDFHHGNGTQAIFYQRNDVLTISIHADPEIMFPYFAGRADETGKGKGKGFNLNLPLSLGIDEKKYQAELLKAVSKIEEFMPSYLVVALGLDTFIDDPIGGLTLRTEYYREMAATLRSLDLPTVIVQEGGYNTTALGQNVSQFLKGFE